MAERAGYAPLEDAFEDASVAVGCLGRAAEGYKQFIETFLQADKVVDMVIGFVVGTAFANVVSALVADLVTPLIAALIGNPNFGALYFTINKSKFMYGDFLNQLITFFMVAMIIYIFVVMPSTARAARNKKAEKAPEPTQDCPFCKSSIPMGVAKCAFCTSELPKAPAGQAEFRSSTV